MFGFSFKNDLKATFDHPHQFHYVIMALIALVLAVTIWALIAGHTASAPFEARIFMMIWLVLSLVAIAFLPRWSFVTAFLVSLLCMLVGWRIAGLHQLDLVRYPLIAVFVVYVVMFFDIARRSIRHQDPALRLNRTDWHLTLIRIYLGFDLVPHFTEKLFAGPGPRNEDIQAFTELGVPMPELFVIVAGLCELGIAIGVGLGIMTRLAACCSALYFLIATILGGHFFLGFIWASPGGGWEYPVLMMILLVSFVIDGAGPFSVDNVLLRRFTPPAWIRRLMVPNST